MASAVMEKVRPRVGDPVVAPADWSEIGAPEVSLPVGTGIRYRLGSRASGPDSRTMNDLFWSGFLSGSMISVAYVGHYDSESDPFDYVSVPMPTRKVYVKVQRAPSMLPGSIIEE